MGRWSLLLCGWQSRKMWMPLALGLGAMEKAPKDYLLRRSASSPSPTHISQALPWLPSHMEYQKTLIFIGTQFVRKTSMGMFKHVRKLIQNSAFGFCCGKCLGQARCVVVSDGLVVIHYGLAICFTVSFHRHELPWILEYFPWAIEHRTGCSIAHLSKEMKVCLTIWGFQR